MISIIYLAAGNSSRFGRNKLFEEIDGKAMYRHGLEQVLGIPGTSVIVVSQYERLLEEAGEYDGVRTVFCEEARLGISYTIRAGIDAIGSIGEEDVLVFMVADQPYFKRKTMVQLLDAVKGNREYEGYMVSSHGRPGNPCAFRAKLVPQLKSLSGDEGGKKVLKDRRCYLLEIEDERQLMDIDRIEEMI